MEGQAAKLAAYANLHDLGEPVAVPDPGASGKDTKRPGLERVRKMVADGNVDHVLIWRLIACHAILAI